MDRTCTKCNNQELTVTSSSAFRYGVEPLKSLVKVEVEFVCPGCGQKSGLENLILDNGELRIAGAERGSAQTGAVKRHHARLSNRSADGKRYVSVDFPAAFRVGENILYPTFEGNLQDGTVIDQHGDPDLMLKFAEQYLKTSHSILPTRGLPNSLLALMPALNLLVIAAELALKAHLVRDDKDKFGHSLRELYEDLEPTHQENVELRFARSDLNTNLAALGVKRPAVEAILGVYDNTYGGESKVYMDSRYYAEPTKTFKPKSSLHGANLVKGNNPYPIFFPEVVRALIETYRFFSGHERLRRLGGDVQEGVRERSNDNHGDWGLIPSSLNLVVVNVPQPAGISAKGEQRLAFEKFLAEHPPVFHADWMYGGNTLLFYGAGEQDYVDVHGILNGVECRVWRHKRLGMHARDLYLLAKVLEKETDLKILSDVRLVSNGSA